MKSRYKEITDWLKEYTPLHTWIYFNVNPAEADNLTVNSIQNERELETFIDSSRTVEFMFAIALAKEFDTGTSDNNLEAVEEFEQIADWVEEQNRLKNFPDFGNNIIIDAVEVLETTPSVSVDNQNQIAKYQGQFKITYLEKGE